MGDFQPYAPAIASLGLWAMMVTVLARLSVQGRSAATSADCGKPLHDYGSPVYRRERAFQNAVEVSGPFIAACVGAILIGAPAFWVNLLVLVFIVARIGMAVVHIATTNTPLRSGLFIVGVVCTLALAAMAIVGAF